VKVLIIGSGRFGATLANRLSKEQHDVTIVDLTPAAFERYLDGDFGGKTLLGDGIDEEVLREGGLAEADAFVAAMRGDNHNLMAAQIAKVLYGVKRVVCRCNDPVRADIYRKLGMAIVCPSVLGADALYTAMMSDEAHQGDVAENIDRMLVR
jgi:trk system potassium uptake protein TrkA